MRLAKFLSTVSLVTIFSLLYVYQQSEIYRLAYLGQKRHSIFQDLLDKNTRLRYNMQKSASLVQIGNKVMDNKDYEMPATFQLVKLSYPLENSNIKYRVIKKQNLIARFFSVKTQAEAKTINP